MKIAVILPSLNNTGPIIVAQEIVNNILLFDQDVFFKVFYFDEKTELQFNCESEKISFENQIEFNEFDIIHSHGFRADKYVSHYRDKISTVTISTIHCDVFEDLKYSYNYLVSLYYGKKWISYLRSKNYIVTLTKFHNEFYSKYVNSKKICTIYNGRKIIRKEIDKVDLELFNSIKQKNSGKIFIGSFAGLTSRKGIHQIINVLPYFENYVYIIIGDGKEKGDLIKLAQKRGVLDRCFFIGYKKDAFRFMEFIDIYALPSYSEAFPLALIEAALYAKSCICSSIPVLKEVFTSDEVTFFENDNVDSLKAAIVESTKFSSIKGHNSKEKTETYYTSEVMAINYMDFYKKILNHE